MSVGLFDYDFLRSKELYFNLDLMKSAGELRKKREITVLSPLFAPEKYSSFYVFQDFPHDNTFFRTDLNDDVKFFGKQFTKGIYVPKDLKIENSVPDATIYEKLRDCVPDKQKIRFTSLINGEHIRLSLDGKTVNPKFESQIGTFHRHCFIFPLIFDI